MDHTLYAPGSIPTHALLNFFSLKTEETCTFNREAIKDSTLCKLHKVPKGFRPMGSNARLGNLFCEIFYSSVCTKKCEKESSKKSSSKGFFKVCLKEERAKHRGLCHEDIVNGRRYAKPRPVRL